MISILQQIKNTLQNKRFVFFTIVFPVVFYIFFVTQMGRVNVESSGMIALFSAMFGIAGSGLNTFSQKVSKEKEYYQIMNKISPHSYGKYMVESVLAQTVLNFLILCCITIVGLVIGNLHVDGTYVLICVLSLYFGLYYILIGFLLGTIFDNDILASASMPIFFGFMILNITPNIIPAIKLPGFIVSIQKVFPAYYYNGALASGGDKQLFEVFLLITVYSLVVALISVVINGYLKIKERNA
ncbi:ABC transporter permease [Lactococcus lactis]|uniref:ABC transporter permease n=1 Tax=Lactococcus lactis TaxID=1358 RepID=UPI0022E67D72|nr:ABC transporter permease [Lactococcus lactis]